MLCSILGGRLIQRIDLYTPGFTVKERGENVRIERNGQKNGFFLVSHLVYALKRF